MIQIITEKIEMPHVYERRFQKRCENFGSKKEKWYAIDIETQSIRLEGKFQDICVAVHNLNKKHYLELKKQSETL
jgi:hypothetical protein